MDPGELKTALEEVRQGNCEANLGGNLYKKNTLSTALKNGDFKEVPQ